VEDIQLRLTQAPYTENGLPLGLYLTLHGAPVGAGSLWPVRPSPLVLEGLCSLA